MRIVWVMIMLGLGALYCVFLFGTQSYHEARVQHLARQAALFGLHNGSFNGIGREISAAELKGRTREAMEPIARSMSVSTTNLTVEYDPLLQAARARVLETSSSTSPAPATILERSFTGIIQDRQYTADHTAPYVVRLVFDSGPKPTYIYVPAVCAGPWKLSGSPPDPWPGFLSSCSPGELYPGYAFDVADAEVKDCTLRREPAW